MKYQIKCNSYSGDLEPDDILISTHVDEIMSRFCWFSNGLSVVTRATSLFCTLAMPLPSLTRAEVKSNRSALHRLRWCQTDGLLRTGDHLLLVIWQPLITICSARQLKTHSKMTSFSSLIEYLMAQ